ncbi:MAG: peptidylprolyl isomerase [Clostridiaceae bacterium]|nr:peptidylprolyl isomerase [Clostridiaceae bacterium]
MKKKSARLQQMKIAVSTAGFIAGRSGSRYRLAACLTVFAFLLFAPCTLAACSSGSEPVDMQGYSRSETATDYVAIITDQDQEAIIIQLYPDTAPLTVENFKRLVGEKFYNGLTFHRVIAGSLIQGGDPSGDGTGGPGYTIKGEFSLNGISNPLNHERGTVSMARAEDYDSAGSQFFICTSAITSLDRKYAVFGKVVAGMAAVDRISSVANSGSPNNRPNRKQIMKEVFFVNPESETAISSTH